MVRKGKKLIMEGPINPENGGTPKQATDPPIDTITKALKEMEKG